MSKNNSPVSHRNNKRLYSRNNKKMMSHIENIIYSKDTYQCRLTQRHFENGTFRIKTPGLYWLDEDIEFSPNYNIYPSRDCTSFPNVLDNFHPTKSQKLIYPSPPYQFGFFAAITVECDNVIIDLNGHTLQQSKMHYFHQRFYSNIELNSSPFIRGQGPDDFGKINFPKNICIRNGTLGRSSHHGIHGNGNQNVLIEYLVIKDFEVAGIALNGSENTVCRHIDIRDTNKDVQINFLYSNAIYTRRFLCDLHKQNKDAFLNINGTDKKNIETIICELQTEMIQNVYIPVSRGEAICSAIFKNVSLMPEGNLYGIVLNKLGAVVGDFLKTYKDNNFQNRDVVVHDILFKNLDSFPREIISLADKNRPVVGLVGNVCPVLDCSDNGKGVYMGNCQVNATCILAKYKNLGFNIKSRSLYMPEKFCDWVESNESLSDVCIDAGLKFVNLRDQMNHFMKGNIIMFISGGTDIRINDIKMRNITNSGPPCDCNPIRIADYKFVYMREGFINYNISSQRYKGQDLIPILITASSQININDLDCKLLEDKSHCKGIEILGDCAQIECTNINIRCSPINKIHDMLSNIKNNLK